MIINCALCGVIVISVCIGQKVLLIINFWTEHLSERYFQEMCFVIFYINKPFEMLMFGYKKGCGVNN